MEIRVLRYFLAVAQEESISGAAEYLHLTQPTLSRQLMDLEAELGKKLLVRGSRKVTLTQAGLLLRRRAEEILDLVGKTEQDFRQPDAVISGEVSIGAGETEAMRLVSTVAKTLQGRYPDIRYHLYSGNAEDVTERLDKGLLDFGILIEPVDISKYDFVKLPSRDIWGLLLRRDHPLAARTVIRPEDLLDLPLLVSRQTLIKNDFSVWLGCDFSTLHIVATYNLIYNASQMVLEGMGCALSLDRLVNTSCTSALCFRPLAPQVEVGMDIVWKKYQVFSRAAEAFRDCLVAAFSGDDGAPAAKQSADGL